MRIRRIRYPAAQMNDDEKFAIRRAIWLAVLFLAIVIVVSAALAHGFGLSIK